MSGWYRYYNDIYYALTYTFVSTCGETLGEDPAKLAWTDDDTPATLTRVEEALAEVTDWAFHETPTGAGVHQRLLSHQVTVCWDDDAVDALPIGELETTALVCERYALCLPEGLVSDVFVARVDAGDLTDAGYVYLLEDGDAWLPSGRLALEAASFYLPVRREKRCQRKGVRLVSLL